MSVSVRKHYRNGRIALKLEICKKFRIFSGCILIISLGRTIEPHQIINYLLVQDKDLWHLLLHSRPSFLQEHLIDEQSPLQ